MKCNLNPTTFINTTAPVMWNVAEHTHAHRQSNQESRGEKVGVAGRIK